jgi:SAM-dependent methyltransferase
MKSLIVGVVFLLMTSLAGSLAAEAPSEAPLPIGPLGPAGAPASAFPKPTRPVASIVSDRWSTEEARDKDGEAAEVLDFLGVGPGVTVADIGAGAGYYTVRAARKVGPTGRVIAEDVVPDFLKNLQQRIAREHLSNVVLDLGEPHDPRLPPRSVDLVLLVHMYHEVEQPYGLLYNLLPALRDRARIAVIDLDRPTERHGTPRALLLCEFHALGFRETHWRWLRERGEYLALFEPPARPVIPDQIKTCGS